MSESAVIPVAAETNILQMPAAPTLPQFGKLSILVPVYNEERYLAAVIKRVVEQPLPTSCGREIEREIIMVNDASKDRTWEIMQQIPALFPQVKFIIKNKTV
ncbi:MAG: glycosyltransferase, partial [Phycisphaerae bacterium]